MRAAAERGPAGYRLDTRLLQFEQWRDGKRYGVEIGLQATLQPTDGGAAVWVRTYTERQVAGDASVHASAVAMGTALSRVFAALGKDLGAGAGR